MYLASARKVLRSAFTLGSMALASSVAFVSACDEEKEEEVAPETTEGTPVTTEQPNSGETEGTGDDGGTDTVADDGATDAAPVDCDSLGEGVSMERTRYEAATATKGLSTCVSEVQTVTCENGTLTATGTFTHESCTESLATLEQGDILVMREEGSGGIGGNGEILAFSPTTGFKGYAYDSAGVVPWYGYGLRLSLDYFDDKYYVEIGSSNSDLAISVRRFPFVDAYPHTLGAWTEGPASDALYFQGAFSEEYGYNRYVAQNDGSELHVYGAYAGHLTNCTITMPAGKHARAIFSGSQGFGQSTFVAYTLGTGVAVTGYGVAKLTGPGCTDGSGSPMTFTTQFENTNFADAKITSLSQVRGGNMNAGSWNHNDLFITVGPFLASQQVRHWHFDGATWSELASPFVGPTTRAIYQDHLGDLYTIETDDDGAHIRRYSHVETAGTHFVATVLTDADQTALKGINLGQWLLVMPALPQ